VHLVSFTIRIDHDAARSAESQMRAVCGGREACTAGGAVEQVALRQR
jgi:hypothetical protein